MIGLILSMLGGAAAMYLLDPKDGVNRRAMVRDQASKLAARASEDLKTIQTQINERAHTIQDMVKKMENKVSENTAITDEVLVARVRSQMGHVVSNANAIEVTAHNGTVTLSGMALNEEEPRLIATVAMIPGVVHVENRLGTPSMISGMETSDTL